MGFNMAFKGLRKYNGEIPKAGNGKRGRPRNSWRRSVIKEAGRSWNELRFLAADRQMERTRRQPMFLKERWTLLLLLLLSS
jgi:hypothetical protein